MAGMPFKRKQKNCSKVNISGKMQIGLQAILLAALYYFLFMSYTANIPEADRSTILWVVSFDFTVLTAGIYFSSRILLSRFFAKGRYVAFIIAYLLMVTVGGLAIVADDWIVLTPAEAKEGEGLAEILTFFFSSAGLVMIFSLVGMGIRGIANWILSVQQLNKIRNERLEMELAFLKSQINPHFLFNTLNLIFGHIDKSNKMARDMMVRFSELMRYQLYECDVAMIDIEKELGYLDHYIEFQKLRKNEALDCRLRRSEGLSGFSLSPLLLIPIVENAFKYVSSHRDKQNFLHIDVSRSGDNFVFSCVNTKTEYPLTEVVKTNGIGLRNVRRRLELIYPDRHRLDVRQDEDTFEVYLTITL